MLGVLFVSDRGGAQVALANLHRRRSIGWYHRLAAISISAPHSPTETQLGERATVIQGGKKDASELCAKSAP